LSALALAGSSAANQPFNLRELLDKAPIANNSNRAAAMNENDVIKSIQNRILEIEIASSHSPVKKGGGEQPGSSSSSGSSGGGGGGGYAAVAVLVGESQGQGSSGNVPSSSVSTTHSSPVLTKKQLQAKQAAIDAENALKVDALISELFPERAGVVLSGGGGNNDKKKGKAGGKKNGKAVDNNKVNDALRCKLVMFVCLFVCCGVD
jgi:hypothetical protein